MGGVYYYKFNFTLLAASKSSHIRPLAFEGTDNVRVLTKFMSDAKRNEYGMKKAYQNEIGNMLSNKGAMITGNDTCFPKKAVNSVGVDREERPNINNIYTSACQRLAGRGGWPLTIIMTPNAKLFLQAHISPKMILWAYRK